MNFTFFDFLIIFIVALGAIKGYRQGLLGSIVSFFGSIAALLLAVKFHKAFAQFIDSHLNLISGIAPFLTKHIPLPAPISTLPVNETGLGVLKITVEQMTLPNVIKEQLMLKAQSMVQTAGELGIATIGELLIYIIALTLINGLAFLLLWLLIQNTLVIIAKFFSSTVDSTFIGSINRLAGLFIGGSLSILVLIIVIGGINLLLEVTKEAQASLLVTVADIVSQSLLVPYLTLGYELLLTKIVIFI